MVKKKKYHEIELIRVTTVFSLLCNFMKHCSVVKNFVPISKVISIFKF